MSAIQPSTLINEWRNNLKKYANLPALSVKRQNYWRTITYCEYYGEAMKFSKSLVALGVPEFSGVSIIGFNAPEWVIGFSGTVFARCIPVGVYATNRQ